MSPQHKACSEVIAAWMPWQLGEIRFGHPRLATPLGFARCVVSAWGGEAAMQSAAARWIMRAR